MQSHSYLTSQAFYIVSTSSNNSSCFLKQQQLHITYQQFGLADYTAVFTTDKIVTRWLSTQTPDKLLTTMALPYQATLCSPFTFWVQNIMSSSLCQMHHWQKFGCMSINAYPTYYGNNITNRLPSWIITKYPTETKKCLIFGLAKLSETNIYGWCWNVRLKCSYTQTAVIFSTVAVHTKKSVQFMCTLLWL